MKETKEMRSTFYKKVDMRSKKAMAQFLANHFRYPTMNSWNRSTSYANCVKVYSLGLPREIKDQLFDLMDCEGFYDDINEHLRDFGQEHNWFWQVGFNGRSSGYLVLYQGGSKKSEYRSFCPVCGQINFTEATETDCRCGRCGRNTRRNYLNSPIQIFTHPGRGTDMEEDFSDWSMEELKDRVRLVQEFDQLCDEVVDIAIFLAENYVPKEEEYTLTQTRKVMAEVEDEMQPKAQ